MQRRADYETANLTFNRRDILLGGRALAAASMTDEPALASTVSDAQELNPQPLPPSPELGARTAARARHEREDHRGLRGA